MNIVILYGKIIKEPEIKYIGDGTLKIRLLVKTTEVFTKNGEKQYKDEISNVIMMGPKWEGFAPRLATSKGSNVIVNGKITNREYIGEDGVKRYLVEVKAETVNLV